MAGKKPTKSPKLDGSEDDSGRGDEQEQGENQQQALEGIVALQNEIDALNQKASEEILHVEQKYNKLRQPHYDKRSELITALPDFWLTTLLNNPSFSELLDEEDETVLQYLTSIKVEEYEDVKSGYKISFYFRANPYFENSVLSKEYVLESSGEGSAIGTDIRWKPGMDLTSRQPSASTSDVKGRKRPHEDPLSFFSWFNDFDPSGRDDAAEIIKDDIWPNPLQYYLSADTSLIAGEEEESYSEDGEGEEGEGEGEGEGEEEDEPEPDDEDEDSDGDPEEVVELSDDDDEEDYI